MKPLKKIPKNIPKKIKDAFFTGLFDRFPFLLDLWIRNANFLEPLDTPWTPLNKPLSDCNVALVTTSGVHLKKQQPFNMEDPDGDPTCRSFAYDSPKDELTITHDYYNHTDADRDLNVVLPVDRLAELANEGFIRKVSSSCYSFMGHIMGKHLYTLIEETAPGIAAKLKGEQVDLVVLTPG